MRILYGKHFEARYKAVSGQIPNGADVLDVCCGDFRIYRKYLRRKDVQYSGMDISSGFEELANKRNVLFEKVDLRTAILPKRDYVLMMSSFYQFYDEKEQMLERLLACTKKKLIITEPVKNVVRGKSKIFSNLAKGLTGTSMRFHEETLRRLVAGCSEQPRVIEMLDGGREIMVVFQKR